MEDLNFPVTEEVSSHQRNGSATMSQLGAHRLFSHAVILLPLVYEGTPHGAGMVRYDLGRYQCIARR